MHQAVKKGWTRTIGVDDYKPAQIENLIKNGGTKPAVNMCDMSMKKHDDVTIEYCQKNGITYNAFGGFQLARRHLSLHVSGCQTLICFVHMVLTCSTSTEVMRDCLFEDPLVLSLAQKYSVSSAQICAVWTRQFGTGCTMSLGTGAK
eukprot:SAG31_NODE_2967_length_4841_cov_4.952552_3_plen_147_part_00